MAQRELDRIAAALAAQPDAQHALQLLLTETRRLTRAEAGTVYLREGNRLRFAAFQNDVLTRRLGAGEAERRLKGDPLTLTEPSIAGYVLLTHGTANVVDAYAIPLDRPYQFDRRVDVKTGYRTQSMLALPIQDSRGIVIGVLALINALNDIGGVIPFDTERQAVVDTLLKYAARVMPT
jgi:GAF domain-containing protein